MSKLKDLFRPRCIHRHDERTHPQCFKDGKPTVNREPEPVKILSTEYRPRPDDSGIKAFFIFLDKMLLRTIDRIRRLFNE